MCNLDFCPPLVYASSVRDICEIFALFQGGSAERGVAKRPSVGGGGPLRSWVFYGQVVLNVDGFG